MLPFYVYILQCADGVYYVGHTDNIEKRISMHNQGQVSNFTQKRLPVEVVFVEEFATRAEAIEMEQRIKGWSRKKKEALIEQNWEELIRLSNLKPQVLYPSTSSGRTERELSAAFTPAVFTVALSEGWKFNEGSGRTEEGSIETKCRWNKTERELSAAFTPKCKEELWQKETRQCVVVDSNKNLSNIGIYKNISLADKNWFATGGSARYFAEPKTSDQMQQMIIWAQQNHIPLFILGSGANILISDDGFDGLVIRPQLRAITHQILADGSVMITAGAGVSLDALIEYCLTYGFIGLEEFSGIPGTVGGAVYINLHYFEFLLSQFLITAEVIDITNGAIQHVDNAWFAFGYNVSTLQDKRYILISATFRVRKADSNAIAYAKGRRAEIIRHRNKRYPQARTCGSFFRNFYEQEVTHQSEGKKVIWVAYYLDKIGVKGMLRIGDAQVSHQHANMIINRGNATSTDIIGVAHRMQELVNNEFGILPQPECQLIGFKKYPLL
jgi:UDP-N-acetylmuramate dehydrogenase